MPYPGRVDITDGPVTLSVTRRVRPGREADFEAWAAEGSRTASTFPGHLGVGVLRPTPGGPPEYTLVVRFDRYANFKSWQESPERAAWLGRAFDLIEGEPREQVQPGMEFWFTPPASGTLRQPPRWKMAALTVLALYPVNLGLNLLLGPLLDDLGLSARLLVLAVLIVVLMTYGVMPLVTRAFAGWLHPSDRAGQA